MAYAPSWVVRGLEAVTTVVRHPAMRLAVVAIAAIDQATRIFARPGNQPVQA